MEFDGQRAVLVMLSGMDSREARVFVASSVYAGGTSQISIPSPEPSSMVMKDPSAARSLSPTVYVFDEIESSN